ncbi:hypothetical protein VB714_00530 [Spirulina sp. 06S082]|nr:hypothetical protein [Spirulina sp. 06S082]
MNKFADKYRCISVGLMALTLVLSPLPSQAEAETSVPPVGNSANSPRRLPALPPLPRVSQPSQNAIAPESATPSRRLSPLPRVNQPPDRTKILPKLNRKVISRQNSLSQQNSPPQRNSPSQTVRSQETSQTASLETKPASIENRQVAQTDNVRRRYINPTWSYAGLGGNLGLSDNGITDLGKGSVAIDAKIALTNYLSLRPAILIGDSTTILLPLTYDVNIQSGDPFEPSVVHPFIGGGLALSNRNTELNNNVAPLATAGVDLRVSDRVVVYSNLSAGFFGEQTEIGARIGVGYVFPSKK